MNEYAQFQSLIQSLIINNKYKNIIESYITIFSIGLIDIIFLN
jgi:hypothetical protein